MFAAPIQCFFPSSLHCGANQHFTVDTRHHIQVKNCIGTTFFLQNLTPGVLQIEVIQLPYALDYSCKLMHLLAEGDRTTIKVIPTHLSKSFDKADKGGRRGGEKDRGDEAIKRRERMIQYDRVVQRRIHCSPVHYMI